MKKRPSNNYELPINLGDNPPVGKFCGYICVYDASGNVSLVESFCITIDSWGGNTSLLGKWRYTKVETWNNGVLSDSQPIFGVVDTWESSECTTSAENSQIIATQNYWIELSADGSFSDNFIDEIISQNPTCVSDDFYEIAEGNWSYNSTANKFIAVQFFGWNDTNNFPDDKHFFNENESIIFNATVESLNSTTLVIREEESNNAIEKVYFTKFN